MLLVLIPIFILISLFIGFLWFVLTLDCDVTLWFAEKLGRKPSTLRGKIVWITGASSGIGEGLAYELAKVGCGLVLSGTNEGRLALVRKQCLVLNSELRKADVLCLPFDMVNMACHQEQFDKVLDHFKRLDILVNNAGRSQRSQFHMISAKVDLELFQLNVFSVVNLSRIVLNYWYDNNNKGHFVVTSSTAGKIGAPNSATYTASKHALHGYFESLRNESYEKGITITMTCPGPVVSNFLSNAFTGNPGETVGESHPEEMKRMTTQRCARLMVVSMANKLDEAWISIQPVLSFYYAFQYLPSISRYLFPRIVTRERLSKLRDGKTTL